MSPFFFAPIAVLLILKHSFSTFRFPDILSFARTYFLLFVLLSLRIHNASEMDEELLTPIRTMLEILEAFKENEEKEEQKEENKFLQKKVYRGIEK